MIELYVTLIINGKRSFASVPDKQKGAVKELLLSLGLDEYGNAAKN